MFSQIGRINLVVVLAARVCLSSHAVHTHTLSSLCLLLADNVDMEVGEGSSNWLTAAAYLDFIDAFADAVHAHGGKLSADIVWCGNGTAPSPNTIGYMGMWVGMRVGLIGFTGLWMGMRVGVMFCARFEQSEHRCCASLP